MTLPRLRPLAIVILALPCLASAAVVDSASFEAGGGAKVQMVRVAVQKHWERKYFQSNGTHVAAFWNFSLAHWRGNAYQGVNGQHQDISDIGATPTFRFQSDSARGWYGEAGIGYHFLSKRYDNDNNKLSTSFQFGDHLGVGYVFQNGWEMGLKLQHFSNGGIKKPNSGVNFLMLKVARPF